MAASLSEAPAKHKLFMAQRIYNYLINGHMIGGFALVAWPAEWDNTGVMTFIVNQQGKVYQKNLGPKTPSLAAAMTTYDPAPAWTPAGEE